MRDRNPPTSNRQLLILAGLFVLAIACRTPDAFILLVTRLRYGQPKNELKRFQPLKINDQRSSISQARLAHPALHRFLHSSRLRSHPVHHLFPAYTAGFL